MPQNGADAFEVESDYLFVGRTFAEYRRLFDLNPTWLAGRSVLECPGGPSSFAAVAAQLDADVTAVDPMYEHDLAALEAEARDAVARNVDQLGDLRENYVWDVYGDVETRGRYLRAAAECFLADYARYPDRYVASALPELPFADGAFDLALSANFLFLYDDRLDLETHVASARELLRVAGEVRLFPLAGLDRERSDYVAPLVDRLRQDGVRVALEEVPYEFQPGATTMLVLD